MKVILLFLFLLLAILLLEAWHAGDERRGRTSALALSTDRLGLGLDPLSLVSPGFGEEMVDDEQAVCAAPAELPGDVVWRAYEGDYIRFRVPAAWQPLPLPTGLGSVLEEWFLGIPGHDSDQTMAFYVMPITALTPNDIVRQETFCVAGQSGVKWVRAGEGYVSYDYYAPGTAATEDAGAASFGLHVNVPVASRELEETLDGLATAIEFYR